VRTASTSAKCSERGDITKFYNAVFAPLVGTFSTELVRQAGFNAGVPLSPLPVKHGLIGGDNSFLDEQLFSSTIKLKAFYIYFTCKSKLYQLVK